MYGNIDYKYMSKLCFSLNEIKYYLFYFQIMVFYFVCLNLAYFKDGIFSSREALVQHVYMIPMVFLMLGLYNPWKKNSEPQSEYNLRSKSQWNMHRSMIAINCSTWVYLLCVVILPDFSLVLLSCNRWTPFNERYFKLSIY